MGATLLGRNGGGDRYFTDGELTVGLLTTGSVEEGRPELLPNPAIVRMKDQFWAAIGPILGEPSE